MMTVLIIRTHATKMLIVLIPLVPIRVNVEVAITEMEMCAQVKNRTKNRTYLRMENTAWFLLYEGGNGGL